MTYGAKVVRDNGSIWATPDTNFFHFERKVRLNTPGFNGYFSIMTYQTGIPTRFRVMPFVKLVDAPAPGDYQQIGATKITDSGGYWQIEFIFYRDPGKVFSFDLYLFSSQNPRSSLSYGIEFYNPSGDIVYSADTVPLQIYTTPTVTSPGRTEKIVDMGESVAVFPTATGSDNVANIAQYTVAPVAYQNSIYFLSNYRSAWAKYGYAEDNIFQAAFSGQAIYIKTALYDSV